MNLFQLVIFVIIVLIGLLVDEYVKEGYLFAVQDITHEGIVLSLLFFLLGLFVGKMLRIKKPPDEPMQIGRNILDRLGAGGHPASGQKGSHGNLLAWDVEVIQEYG